ncbi:DDE-type integrase/transposase/recombinase [Muricoccus vinaceus]|uniref:DDE-type integrase/transposase/recombinase n=1 Tax=Muricoccus vinaceus TaxID=424704 RepID=A0ABV6J489_9PROT
MDCVGCGPESTSEHHHGRSPPYPRAIHSTLGRYVKHRTSRFRKNGPEQDHSGIKGRIRCMRGFKSLSSAARFCRGYDELRNHLHPSTRHRQHVPADRRRFLHIRYATTALAILQAG